MKTYPYGRPAQLSDNLWEILGQWSNAFGRRMTIVRTTKGDLFVHNAIRLDAPDLEWLRSLGTVRGIIAPNKFHTTDAPWMAREFPGATLFVPSVKLVDFGSAGFSPRCTSTDFGGTADGELESVPVEGTRVDESAFIHHPSRTLILCDLAMNMEDVFTGLWRPLMRWNNVGGRFGVTRLTKWVFSNDERALVASYRSLLERDFDRIIVNHGAVLESNGRELLARSVQEVFAA